VRGRSHELEKGDTPIAELVRAFLANSAIGISLSQSSWFIANVQAEIDSSVQWLRLSGDERLLSWEVVLAMDSRITSFC
jgi:hypothetical protein